MIITYNELYKSVMNELNILRKLDNPHIIKLFELYEDAQALFICFEYIEGLNLFQYFNSRRICEAEIAHIFEQIL